MSEFSESYHLEAGDQQEGVGLLRRANLEGFVFPEQNGWVTIIPRSEFGRLPKGLADANRGWLLHYLLDEDGGWMYAILSGPRVTCRYETRWLDWSDKENRIAIDAGQLDLEVVRSLAERHGEAVELQARLEQILSPRIMTRTDEATGASWEAFTDWPAEKLDDNVAYAFARVLGLPRYEWLGWGYLDESEWGRQGAVHVRSTRRRFRFF